MPGSRTFWRKIIEKNGDIMEIKIRRKVIDAVSPFFPCTLYYNILTPNYIDIVC